MTDRSEVMTPLRPTERHADGAAGDAAAAAAPWRNVTEATVERHRAIVEAHRDGPSLRDIADLVGISYSGVDKIIRRLNGSDVITVWTTPVNFGKRTRYNLAGTVPARSRVRFIELGDQIMFAFDNRTDAAVPVDNHTYFNEVGADSPDRYRMEVVGIE